jgi:hypothetical protein
VVSGITGNRSLYFKSQPPIVQQPKTQVVQEDSYHSAHAGASREALKLVGITEPLIQHSTLLPRLVKQFIRRYQANRPAGVNDDPELKQQLLFMMNLLNRNPDWVNKRDNYGIPLINHAIAADIPELTRTLMSYCPTLASPDEIRTAQEDLWNAYKQKSPGAAGFVLEQLQLPGVNVNQPDENGDTALGLAAFHGRGDMVETLLHVTGIKLDEQDGAGNTPLINAIQNSKVPQRLEIVKALLKAGADVNRSDAQNNPPLWHAILNIQPETVAILLQAPRFDMGPNNALGESAILLANLRGALYPAAARQMVEMLEAHMQSGQ